MSDHLTTCVQNIVDAAKSLEVEVENAPKEWAGDHFNSEILSSETTTALSKRDERLLPTDVRAYRLDHIPVLIGELLGAADRVQAQDSLRRFRNQGTIARTWLGIDAANLQIFLIGPPGSSQDLEWRYLAAEMEADDRICRKLVWLPAASVSIEDARTFLQRTFLARPWDDDSQPTEARLDQMGTIDLPKDWATAIDDDALDADGLIAQLIASGMESPS